jgi:hypothetical protein
MPRTTGYGRNYVGCAEAPLHEFTPCGRLGSLLLRCGHSAVVNVHFTDRVAVLVKGPNVRQKENRPVSGG